MKVSKPLLLEMLPNRKDYRLMGLFKCQCGNTFTSRIYDVESSRKKTCGCSLLTELNRAAHTKHNRSRAYEYGVWRSMKKRCLDPNNHAYEKYKGKLCDEWLSFENFFADMGEAPSDRRTIDRIDNSGGYNKENCRWANMQEQQRNRGNTLWVEADGVKMRLTEYAESKKLTYSAAYMRLWRDKLPGVVRL